MSNSLKLIRALDTPTEPRPQMEKPKSRRQRRQEQRDRIKSHK